MGLFLCYNRDTKHGGKYMAYNKHTWTTQELITSDKLNNIETGISENIDGITTLNTKLDNVKIDSTNQDFSIGARWFAHRGAQSIAPENSIPAMEKVYNHSGMEIDIHQTKDGEWVVMHDGTIDRMTSKTGNISSYNFSDLRAILISKGNGVSKYSASELVIPTLEEALSIAKDKRIIPVIEIKQDSGDVYTEDSWVKLAALIDKYNMRNQVIFISFSYECLQAIKKQLPAVEVSWLIQDGITPDKISKAVSLGVNSGIDSNDKLTEQNVIDAHAKGLKVGVWTMNDDSDRDKWVGSGVDYITTNSLSGDLQYQELTPQNGWLNQDTYGGKLHVVEIADGKILISGIVMAGTSANAIKGTTLTTLPKWAIPKYDIWNNVIIRTSSSVISGTLDVTNTGDLKVGFNWDQLGGSKWVSIQIIYMVK